MQERNPKLHYVMEEIKDVLNKHDVAGVIMLHTPGHGEFHLSLDPSFSIGQMNEDGKVLFRVEEITDENKIKMLHSIDMVVNLGNFTDMIQNKLAELYVYLLNLKKVLKTRHSSN